MRKLYELATTPTKVWKPLPGGDHNSSVLEEGYFEAISDFVSNAAGDEKLWFHEYRKAMLQPERLLLLVAFMSLGEKRGETL